MKESDKLGNYILDKELGRGVSAATWLVHKVASLPGTDTAVLKILDLSEASSWNMVDVFKREAEALKILSHPGIPKYLEYFESNEDGRIRLVIAMEYIEGQNLESIVKSGKKFAETQVERILAELSDILAYLGSLRPPIVHRDVNPRNIIMRSEGSIALVDFSGVQDAVRTALFPGATLVGTAGYIPLEQVAGKATHRSDLYGAAATAVFLLTGRNPAELPTSGLKINLSGVVDVSERLSAVLSSWLDPDVAQRSLTASQASRILRGEQRIPHANPSFGRDEEQSGPQNRNQYSGAFFPDNIRLSDIVQKVRNVFSEQFSPGGKRTPSGQNYPESLPSDSKILVETSEDGVVIKIPRPGIKGSTAPGMRFATLWVGFVAFWTFMSVGMRAPFFFPLFSIPFLGVGIVMVRTMLGPAITKQDLVITREGLLLRKQALGMERNSTWPLRDIGAIRMTNSRTQTNGAQTKELSIEAGTGQIRLGAGLSERELLYLEGFLQNEVRRLRDQGQ